MCVWCEGAATGLDGFAIETRGQARLAGRWWQGTHADAVAGGLREVLAALRERILEEPAFAPGPVVVVTLAGQGDDVRCFAGARLEDGASLPDGLEEFLVPACDYASALHRATEGEVIDRYAAMLDWMRAERLSRDCSQIQHREEYPLHADFARPEAVRLMVPIVHKS
ncbi:GyrI-like domain-containing protein [Mesorhizobium australicum]|uniref:GyrI-like small molecule binding domain-containing protein n=1 Tax=Mesorhizobium australicum TaxID=536018 RepID=A0A1X7PC11_9HYPH|nr:GyrI-like domain-containing protein [Mesorhizobium australicum]SMH47835.1 hypothetical protein SAMN02982922_3593 [Mesorhizobium australicum]